MLKSSTDSYKKTNDNYNIDLQEEVCDLKAMLEMQTIINQEQEGKLNMINEEKKNLMNEKNYCIGKLSKMEKEVEDKATAINILTEKIAELEEKLKVEKQNLEEEREKVNLLTKDNKNLIQNLEKKARKIKKLECQLEDERTFYAQEKSRYCKEMKRRKSHTTEVQTDNSTFDDESVYTQKSENDSMEIKQLKALYKHQLITTCLVCEKYIRLRRQRNVLLSRLSHTRKEYKKAMCNIMLEFDKCRTEYTALLEDKYNEDNPDNLLKIVNRSNRLASDNAVLKQELLHLNNRLCIMKSYYNLKDNIEVFTLNQNPQCSDDDDENKINNDSNNVSSSRKKQRRRKNKVRKNNQNSDLQKKYYSSGPASSENDSTDYCKSKYYNKKSANFRAGFKKHSRRLSDSSNTTLIEESNSNIKEHYSRVNVCPSFISFSSDNASKENNKNMRNFEKLKINHKKCRRNSDTGRNIFEKKDKKNETVRSTKKTDLDEPAYIQVTCNEMKTIVKNNSQTTNRSTKPTDSLKNDLQEWLAKAPIIECTEWSKSIQGSDIIKTESAPELFLVSSKSSLSVPRYNSVK